VLFRSGDDDNLNSECYDALAFIAGKPKDWDRLREQIDNISGWGGTGANFEREDVQNAIKDYGNSQAEPEPKESAPVKEVKSQTQQQLSRQQKFEKFYDTLKRLPESDDVSQQTIHALGQQNGLSKEEVDAFITWLSEVDGGDIDFTDKRVREMCDVFIKASGSKGDRKVFGSALMDFAKSSVGKDDNLNPECYDALAFIAGEPRDCDRLKEQIGNISGWWGSGSNFQKEGVQNAIRDYMS